MIFILDRQERIINILKNNGGTEFSPFFDDVLTEDLTTGGETFQFSTIANRSTSKDLVVGNFVAFKKDSKIKLFQIMQVEESHEEVIYTNVYCESAGLELINKIFRKTTINSATLRKFMETVLSDTGWNVGMLEAGVLHTLDLEIEEATVYSVLQNVIKQFECELEFRVEINNGRIASKFVDVYKSRGKVTGKRFVFGQDIEGIVRKTDFTNFYTALIGSGKNGITFKDITVDGIDKPLGQDFVADQEAFEKYNHNGYHIMGKFEFDTTSPEELLRETYKKLQEVKEVRYEYEVSVSLLGRLLGEKWNDVAIGDTVAIVDNAFNPPINLMARVSKLETSKTNPQGDTCTLTNFIEVASNISDEMRKVASELEGYVDSRFPIKEEDISNGAVTGDKISNAYTQTLTTDILHAGQVITEKLISDYAEITDAKIENLKAENVQIGNAIIENAEITNAKIESLEAKDGYIENLVSKKANIEDLNSINATIENLKVKDADIENAIIDNAEITFAKIDQLEANVGKIDSVISGNISSSNIQTGGITGDNLNMETIFVRDANILDLSASKLTAGEINTSQIVITSEDGGMRLVGSTQQFVDENNRIRIQLGKDAKGDFDFYILAENGDILFNTRGITGNAIENGLIKENMVSDGAIGGKKINWQSFTTEFNKSSNTHKLNSSKVLLDGTNQTLDIHFNSLKSTVDNNVSQTESNTTQLNVHQGKINTLIQDTTITKDGKNVKLKDEYSKLEQTVGGLKSTVGEQQTTINQNTGKITATESKVSTLEQTVNGFNSELSHVKTTIDEQEEAINSVNSALSGKANSNDVYKKSETMTTSAINSAINQSADSIKLGISETYETKNNVETKVTTTLNSAKSYADTKKQEAISTASTDATNKVNSAKTELNNKIDGIQIGGRNLLLNSDNGYLNNLNVYNNTNVTYSNVDGWRRMTFTNQLNNEIVHDKWVTPMQLGDYTFSIMCRTDATSISSNISVFTNTSGHRTVTASVENLGNGLYRIVSSFSISNLDRIRVVDLQNFVTVGATYVEFRYPMLEVGNKASAWSQAPEDVDSAINKKANSTDVYTKSQVYTKEETNSQINIAKDQINLNVSNTYETKANIESKITTAVNNIQIGGRNLATHTNQGTTGWVWGLQTGGKTISEVTENGIRCCKMVRDNVASTGWSHISYSRIGRDKYLPNKQYTVSFEVKSSVATDFWCSLREGNSSNPLNVSDVKATVSKANTWTKLSFTLTTKDTLPTSTTQGVYLASMNSGTGVSYIFRNLMIEEGTKASSWSPSPEDVNASIDDKASKTDVYKKSETYTKSETDSKINIAKDQINLNVSNTYETKANVETKINSAVNNVQIGGRNLLPKNSLRLNNSATGTFDSTTNTWSLVAPKGSNSWGSGLAITTPNSIVIPYGQGVTYSFEIKVSKQVTWNFDVNNVPVSGSSWVNNDNDEPSKRTSSPKTITKVNEWVKCWVYAENSSTKNTNKVDIQDSGSAIGLVTTNETSDVTFYIRNVKAELGNKPTDWSPCPTDVENSINSKASKTDVYTKSQVYTKEETNSQINIAKDNINLGISNTYETKANVESKVNNAVTGLKVGGNNLLRNGNFVYDMANWSIHDMNSGGTAKSVTVSSGGDWIPSGKKALQIKGTNTTDRYGAISSTMKLIPNTKYTISGYCSGHRVNKIQVNVRDVDASMGNIHTININPVQGGNTLDKWYRFETTFTTSQRSNYELNLYSVNCADNGYVWFCDVQIQQGTKATAWTPCLEDINTSIDKKANSSDVYKKSETYTKSETDSKISVAKNDITLSVSNTYETKTNVESKINTAVNNVQIGGRNLFLNSGFTKGLNYWYTYNCSNPQAVADSSALSGYAVKFTSTGGGIYQRKGGASNNPTNYPNGSVMTVSGYVKSSVANKVLRPNFENAGTNTSKNITCTNANTWYYFTHTYKIASNGFSTVTFYGDSGADYYLKDVILEYGNKASTWTQAPEDIDSAIGTKANSNDVYKKTEVYTKAETNSQINVAKDSITSSVSQNYVTKGDASNTYATKSSLTQTSNSITAKFEESGGSNLVKNGAFKNGTAYWTKWGSPSTYQVQNSSNGYGQELRIVTTDKDQGAYQTIEGLRTGRPHTVVADVWVANGACIMYIVDGGTWRLSSVSSGTGWKKLHITFTPSNTSVTLRIGRGTEGSNGDYRFTGIRMYEGEAIQAWTPHHSEVYNGSTVIDATGLTVNNGAIKVKNKAGNTVLSGDSNGNLTLNGTIKSEAGNGLYAALNSGGITFRDSNRSEEVLRIGTSFSEGNRDINGVTFAMPQYSDRISFRHIQKPSLENGWSSSDTAYGFMEMWSNDYTGSNGTKNYKGVNVFAPMYLSQKIRFRNGGDQYLHEVTPNITWNNMNKLMGVYGDNGTVIGYKSADNLQARIVVTEGNHPNTADVIKSWGNWNCSGATVHNATFSGKFVNSYANPVTRTFSETSSIMTEGNQVRVNFENIQIKDGKAILSIPKKYRGINEGYIVSSIVKKGRGDVWVSEEEEERFIIEAENDIKINIEIIIKLTDMAVARTLKHEDATCYEVPNKQTESDCC